MDMQENPQDKHEARVKEMLATGQKVVIVSDSDNDSRVNGWADFLMNNYKYSNINSGLRVNLEMPITI